MKIKQLTSRFISRFSNVQLIILAFILTLAAVTGFWLSTQYRLQPIVEVGLEEKYHREVGSIAMNQGVKKLTFSFHNSTDQPMALNKLYTSCMCTKAKLIVGQTATPFAGMIGHTSGLMPLDPDLSLQPGQTAQLQVEFDPNAHGPEGVGPMTRSIIIETDHPQYPQLEFSFSGVVEK